MSQSDSEKILVELTREEATWLLELLETFKRLPFLTIFHLQEDEEGSITTAIRLALS